MLHRLQKHLQILLILIGFQNMGKATILCGHPRSCERLFVSHDAFSFNCFILVCSGLGFYQIGGIFLKLCNAQPILVFAISSASSEYFTVLFSVGKNNYLQKQSFFKLPEQSCPGNNIRMQGWKNFYVMLHLLMFLPPGLHLGP